MDIVLCRIKLLEIIGQELCYHGLTAQIEICDRYLDAADRDVAEDLIGVFVIRQAIKEIQPHYDPPNGLAVTRASAMDSLYVPVLRAAVASLGTPNERTALNQLIQALSV